MNTHLHPNENDRRSYTLQHQRDAIERLDSIIATHRRSWPLELVPDWLDALMTYREDAVRLVRDGRLKKLSEVCNASD